jgi:hypothetical protein
MKGAFPLTLLLLLFCPLMISAWSLDADGLPGNARLPETIPNFRVIYPEQFSIRNEEQVSAEAEDQEQNAATSLPRRRIIDPQKISLSTPWPGRIVLAPFRYLAPRINHGLTKFEQDKVLEKIQRVLARPELHPVFGSLGDGSGFGFGWYSSTAPVGPKQSRLWIQSQFTFRRYSETWAGLELAPTERFRIELTGRYRFRPEEDFHGVGHDSLRSQRSTYTLKEGGVGVGASYNAPAKLRVGAGMDFSHGSIGNGRDHHFPTLSQTFASQINAGLLPGARQGVTLLSPSAFIEFDRRDEPGNPGAGLFARWSVAHNLGLNRGGRTDFTFTSTRVDVQSYLPLWTKRRVLALRVLGDFNHAGNNGAIPFFRLARLGDQQTLRGYNTFRFHGHHALAGSFEYHNQLVRSVRWMSFADWGQVFNVRSELSWKNLRMTWGTGVEFTSKRNVAFKALYARSPEGGRLIFGFGPSWSGRS